MLLGGGGSRHPAIASFDVFENIVSFFREPAQNYQCDAKQDGSALAHISTFRSLMALMSSSEET